jgi:GTP cyclohydrolase I
MGRVRTADRYAPRPIDLDVVLYGEAIIKDDEIQIPDPHIFDRPFMARALADVNPDYVIPPDGPTPAELVFRLRVAPGEMAPVEELSNQIREWVEKNLEEPVEMSENKASRSHVITEESWEHELGHEDRDAVFTGLELPPAKAAAHAAIADAVRTILLNVGEDPLREGLLKTPDRVARAYDELLAGYRMDPEAVINDAFFDTEYHDMVVVKDIEYYSLCEHHLLPFFGKAHVAYIPEGQVLGLSKIPRIVEMYARRLQLQEKMTHQIADFIEDLLHPRGVAVIVTGQHMCSTMRGVNQSDAKMVTQVLSGQFQNRETREQLNERLEMED